MKLYVRLHNSMAVTGLLRCINLSAWHIHNGGQISWSWPWSTGPINHDLMRQKSCHIALAGRSTYQSRHVQGWSDPRWLMSLITLDSTVTQRGKTSRKMNTVCWFFHTNVLEHQLSHREGSCWAHGEEIFLASLCENCHRTEKTTG